MTVVSALQNLKYMLERPSINAATTEELQSYLYISTFQDKAVLSMTTNLPKHQEHHDHPIIVPGHQGWGGSYFREGERRREKNEYILRLAMALVGGLALIGPMLIMRLHPTLLTELLTASLFVLAFSLLIAWYLEFRPAETLTFTAAYAAVLVVFVGSGS